MDAKSVLKVVADLAEFYKIDKPYIVGGLPRDVYMKKPIKTSDVDITTNSAEALRLGILVADKLNVTFELADDGHVTVFGDEFDLDFSSHFISEAVVEYLNKKDPQLHEVYSRDFTINTLHQDLVTGEIIDPLGMGFEDIENKLIRTPVPAKITLNDDPKRVYRAINLAARYKFKIDQDIIDFCHQNQEIFTAKKVKDKYVALKIGKALKEDEEYTLQLLKDLNIFKSIPLIGDFKDVLIRRKMLADYLE
jgi:tRNA nucleotidyltransferase/poly(A) polymerase